MVTRYKHNLLKDEGLGLPGGTIHLDEHGFLPVHLPNATVAFLEDAIRRGSRQFAKVEVDELDLLKRDLVERIEAIKPIASIARSARASFEAAQRDLIEAQEGIAAVEARIAELEAAAVVGTDEAGEQTAAAAKSFNIFEVDDYEQIKAIAREHDVKIKGSKEDLQRAIAEKIAADLLEEAAEADNAAAAGDEEAAATAARLLAEAAEAEKLANEEN